MHDNAVEKGMWVVERINRISVAQAAALGLFLTVRGSGCSMTIRQVSEKFKITEKKLRKCLSKLRKSPKSGEEPEDKVEKRRREDGILVPSVTCKDTLSVLERLGSRAGAKSGVMKTAREFVLSESLSGNLPSTVAAGALAIGLQANNEAVDYQSLSDLASISKQTLLSYLKSIHTLAPQQCPLLSAKRNNSSKPVQGLLLAAFAGKHSAWETRDMGLLDEMKQELARDLEDMKGPEVRRLDCLSTC